MPRSSMCDISSVEWFLARCEEGDCELPARYLTDLKRKKVMRACIDKRFPHEAAENKEYIFLKCAMKEYCKGAI